VVARFGLSIPRIPERGEHYSRPTVETDRGSTTVQGTSHLAETVSKQAKSASDARTAFNAELKKIEGCV
jgi:hypothetical protein